MIPTKKHLSYTLAAALSLPTVWARENAFSRVYSSVRDINLAELYTQTSSIFDFFLALILFSAIARAVFQKRFPGKPGRALSTVMGILLALGLVVAENLKGFNLATVFSPLALIGTFVLVGIALYSLLHAVKVPAVIAGSSVYALIYLCFLGLAPEYIQYLQSKVPELEVALFIAFIISLVVLAVGGYRAIKNHLPRKKEGSHTDKIASDEIKHAKKEVRQERKLERSAQRTENKGVKDTKKIIHELNVLSEAVKHPENRGQVQAILHKLKYNDEKLHKLLDVVKSKHDKIRALDIQAYNELARRYKGSKLEEQQELLRVELEAETRKLRIEEKLDDLERALFKLLADFDDHVRLSLYHYNAGESDISQTTILRARDIMKQIENKLTDLEKLDWNLDKLCKFQLKREIEQAKTVINKAA